MQLRVFIAATVLLVGYVGVYMPLDSSITETTRKLDEEEKRLGVAKTIEYLRDQQKQYRDRVPVERDPNEWVAYVLGKIRTLPLKLVALEAKTPQDIGPYKAVVINCELEGGFFDIDSLVRWIEFNDRLLRIDSLRISPHRSNNGTLVCQLIILGVMN